MDKNKIPLLKNSHFLLKLQFYKKKKKLKFIKKKKLNGKILMNVKLHNKEYTHS